MKTILTILALLALILPIQAQSGTKKENQVKAESKAHIPIRLTKYAPFQQMDRLKEEWTKPIDMSDSGGTLTLKKGWDDQGIEAHTCKEYFELLAKGYSAYTTYDLTMESWFKEPCVPLKLLADAQPAQNSYLRDVSLSAAPLPLPPALGPILSGDEMARVERMAKMEKTWREIWPDAEWTIHGPNRITVTVQGLRTTIETIAWADFNADGFEDMLLFIANHATEGSFRSYRHVVVTRMEKDGLISIVLESN